MLTCSDLHGVYANNHKAPAQKHSINLSVIQKYYTDIKEIEYFDVANLDATSFDPGIKVPSIIDEKRFLEILIFQRFK